MYVEDHRVALKRDTFGYSGHFDETKYITHRVYLCDICDTGSCAFQYFQTNPGPPYQEDPVESK
jgi:hypothetical protein